MSDRTRASIASLLTNTMLLAILYVGMWVSYNA